MLYFIFFDTLEITTSRLNLFFYILSIFCYFIIYLNILNSRRIKNISIYKMNTVVRRTLSSVIANESIVKNISQLKSKNFRNTTSGKHNKNGNKNGKINDDKKQDTKQKKHKYHNEDCIESAYKRQKKTHYNEKMEPIRLSGTSISTIKPSTTSTAILECNSNSADDKVGASGSLGNFPKRIREVVWTTYNGETYSSKCYVSWCNNIINVFNYQVGHDIPESKGGTYDIGNLRPICSNCNLSMGNKWTIQEWGKLVSHRQQHGKEQPGKEQTGKEQTGKEQTVKEQIIVDYNISNDTSYRITLYTLLFLVVSYMIF